MAVLLMLVQLVLAIAASVAALRDITLKLEHATMLLGVTCHVSLSCEGFVASSTSPARTTIGSDNRAGSGRREGAAHGRCRIGGLSTKASVGCAKLVTAIDQPDDGGVVGRVETGVDVTSRIGAITKLKRNSSTGALNGGARGSDIADSVTKVVVAIVPEVTGSVDTAIDVVGIWNNRSILKGTTAEARSSNVVVWREACFDIVSDVTGSVDIAIDVVGIWNNRSILKGTTAEARSSNVVV
ncbi:hypothetical protein HO173_005001 [Letharia columbiana]|uniref:Secreted protein n=1 Tax=Letharia columbiana TaxID=112416 RepID=A0A8H6L5T5_9LECA|nr:uncharacterized protein HO173_005001 [Letharia columbiana]KAF6236710.1 hypothetical protein HO173_005001 [Letharia columbiana]